MGFQPGGTEESSSVDSAEKKKESEVKDNQEESKNINVEESVEKKKLTPEELEEIRKERREERQEKIAELKGKKKRTKADNKELGNLEKREFSEDIIAARKKLTSLEKNSDEYKEAYKEYNELRAQYVSHNEERALKENQRVVRDEITENSKEKGFGTKFYEAYKKMGEWNLAKLLGKEVMEKLESKEDDSRLNKIGKGLLRFSTKMVSVRTGISFGLLAAGGAIGGGALLAGMAGGKILAGAGGTFGAYDLMKAFGKERKGKFKELNTEEVESKDTKELYEILDHLDSKALLNNEKGYRGKTYNLIKDEIVKRSKKEKPENEKSIQEQVLAPLKEKISKKELEALIKDREELRGNVSKELKTSERWRKGRAAAIGVFIGSGAFANLCSKGVNSVMGLFEEAGETSDVIIDSATETADTVVEATETVVTPDTVVESIAEVKSGDTVWKLAKEQLAQRIDNWDSLSDAQQTHMIDMVKDKVVADPGSFGLDTARENIFNSPAADILKVGDKINFSEAFTDTNITSEIDKLGALGSGEGLTTLSGVQEANILSNNEVLSEAAKEGIHMDSANVNMVAEEMKRSGSDFIAKQASLGTKISPFSVDGEPVTIASNNTTYVFQNSGEAVPTEELVNKVSHPNAQEILEKLGVKNTEQFLSLETLDKIPEVDLGIDNALASAEAGTWTEASYTALKDNPEQLTEAFKKLITAGDQESIKAFITDFGEANDFNFTAENNKAEMFIKFLSKADETIDINDLGDNIDNLDSNALNDLMNNFDNSVVSSVKDIGKETSLAIIDGKYAYINKVNRLWPMKDFFNYQFADGSSGTIKGAKELAKHLVTVTSEPVAQVAPEVITPDTATVDTSTVTPEPSSVDSAAVAPEAVVPVELEKELEEVNKLIDEKSEEIRQEVTTPDSATVDTSTVTPEPTSVDSFEADFDDLDKTTEALDTFNNPDVSYEDKIVALKSVIKDGERMNDFIRQGDKIFYSTTPGRGIELTPETVEKINEATRLAKEKVAEGLQSTTVDTSTVTPEPTSVDSAAVAETSVTEEKKNFLQRLFSRKTEVSTPVVAPEVTTPDSVTVDTSTITPEPTSVDSAVVAPEVTTPDSATVDTSTITPEPSAADTAAVAPEVTTPDSSVTPETVTTPDVSYEVDEIIKDTEISPITNLDVSNQARELVDGNINAKEFIDTRLEANNGIISELGSDNNLQSDINSIYYDKNLTYDERIDVLEKINNELGTDDKFSDIVDQTKFNIDSLDRLGNFEIFKTEGSFKDRIDALNNVFANKGEDTISIGGGVFSKAKDGSISYLGDNFAERNNFNSIKIEEGNINEIVSGKLK